MKKSVLIAFALLLTLNTVSFAQKQWSDQTINEIKKQRGDASPAERAAMQTKEITLALDLNEAQQKDVEAVLADYHSEIEANRNSIKKSFNEMSDEDKRAMKSAHLDAQIAMKKEMKKILNKEQYQQFSAKMLSQQQKMKKHRSVKGK
ncbi:MAG: hypothetical protein AAGH46_05315 [Bacteroidota bacterium]